MQATNDKQKILIVDDNQANYETLVALIGPLKYDIVHAKDGLDAISKCIELQPDLVLLDVMMPGISGFTTCHHLRENPATCDIPIIMVTSLDDRSSRIAGITAGADDFVSRPFDASELQARIKCVTKLNRFRRLSQDRAKFKWIANNSADCYIIVDSNYDITYANEAARLYFGIVSDREVCLDVNFLELIEDEYRMEPQAAWAESLKSEFALDDGPLYLILPETVTSLAVWLQVEAFRTTDRNAKAIVFKMKDVSELMRVGLLTWSFSNHIAHKIRTPLSGIINCLASTIAELNQTNPGSEALKFSEYAMVSAERLQNRLERIVQLANVRRVPLSEEGFLLSNLEQTVENTAKSLGITNASVVLPERLKKRSLPLSCGDIETILHNVFQNSLSFHPDRNPAIEVCVEDGLDKSDYVLLKIKDDGLHLAPSHLRRIFTPYYQAEKRPTGELPGMGLGLSIVASLAWSVGGTCEICNRQDRSGLELRIQLPMILMKLATSTDSDSKDENDMPTAVGREITEPAPRSSNGPQS